MMYGRTATILAATLVLATHTASDAASIAPALSSCCLAQKEPVLDPFAPKPKPADPQPAAPKTPSLNPFAPPPADNQPNPFAPKKPAESTTKPTEKPKETPLAEAPKPPAELLIGTAWNVKPDPATTPLAAAAPAAIPAPGAPASSDLRRERIRYRVISAAVPAPVVGLGLNEKENDSRDIWDLVANRKIGTIKGLALEGSRLMTLSPDAQLFAAKPQFDDFVVLVNSTTGKTQKTIPLGGMRLDLIALPSPTRLVLAEDGRVAVHALPGGAREREITIDRWSVRDGWALSPGGRYLAALHRESGDRNLVTLVDLASGETAGTCRLIGEGDVLGIAISRDGKKLAGVVDRGDRAQIILVDLAAPGRLPDIVAPATDLFSDTGYQGPVIEWLPDGNHLILAGRLVIDASKSEVARTLPAPPPSPLVSIGPGITLTFDGRELREQPLGLAIDPALLASINPAGTAAPSTPSAGPGVLQPDRSQVSQKSIPDSVRWNVRLAAPPGLPERLDTNGFKVPGGYVHQLLFSTGSPPIAAVSYAEKSLASGASSDTAAWLETFDLQSGNPVNRVDFGFPAIATSIAPGGKFVATLSPDDQGRVDLFSLEDDRHLGGFQPAGVRPDRQLPWYVEFVDPQHLLIAIADELSLWEIPSCRQLYTVNIGSVRPALSPARDYALVSVPGYPRIAVLETLTGEVRGSIATSELPGDQPLTAAFHHRGRWAAALSGGAGGGELRVVDTDSGRETSTIRLPVSSDVLQFCDDDHVLIGGQYLVSLAKQQIVWTYDLANGLHSRDTLGGYHWYIAAVNPSDRAFIVLGAALPEDAARKQIETQLKSAAPLFSPTDSVRVEVAVTELDAPHIVKHLKEVFTKRYESAGIKTAPDAPFALVIDPGRMGVSRTCVWKVSLLKAGQPIWNCWVHGTPAGALLLSSEPTGTETRFADPPEIRTALAGLLRIDPPKFAFAPAASQGAGASQLTTSGPRPQK